MFRQNSRKKMAVGRGAIDNNKNTKCGVATHKAVSTTQFKSKLALALSNKHCTNDGAGVVRQPSKRGDYYLLENVLANNTLPLTATLKQFVGNNENNNNQQSPQVNGVATIHAYRQITTLHCQSTSDGSDFDLPINNGNMTVNFLSIDNTCLLYTSPSPRDS